MNESESFVIDTLIGRLSINVEDSQLVKLELNSRAELKAPTLPFSQNVLEQINHYFNDAKFQFNLSLKQKGTEHQLKVWQALSNIPSGDVLTYGQLAEKTGSSPRAVGNACRNNPLPLIVPCHRIVAASDIGGFSGKRKGILLDIKRDLLNHEGGSY